MPKIFIPGFKGTLPKVPDRLLPVFNAQTATNVDLNTGTLKPTNTYATSLALSGSTLRSFFKVKSPTDNEDFWATSTLDVDYQLSPVILQASEYGRFYYTDGVIPKKSNFSMASDSGTDTNGSPDEYFNLGVPAPPSALTATIQGTGDGVAHSTVSYVYTYVTSWGEESLPSDPSNTIDVETGEYVQLSGFVFSESTLTLRNIVGVRIYRANVGDTSTEYQLMNDLFDSDDGTYKKIMDWNTGTGTIAISGTAITGAGTNFDPEIAVNDWVLCKGQMFKIATRTTDTAATSTYAASPEISAGASFEYDTQPWTTVDDDDGTNELIDSGNLGDVLETDEWDEPYDDFVGLLLLSNNCMAAFKDGTNEVYVSEPIYPFTFPYATKILAESTVIGLGFYDTTIAILTNERPCLAEVSDPRNVIPVFIRENQACLWKKAIVNGNGFTAYPSPDGLIKISSEGLENLTESIYTKAQWESLLTTTNPYDKEIIATLYDDKYIAFFKGTENGFELDLKTFDYRSFSLPSTIDVYDTYVDAEDDTLYLLADVSGSPYVIEWQGSASYLTYTWKSKKFYFPIPILISCGLVPGDYTSGVTLKVYADGTQVGGDITVSSNSPFWFGSGGTQLRAAREWEFQFSGTEEVYQAIFATTMMELMETANDD
jgi:hypothetical protein